MNEVSLCSTYEKYCKHLIPKEEYFKFIDYTRKTSETKNAKSRHEYYLLSKYEVGQCDAEIIIKK